MPYMIDLRANIEEVTDHIEGATIYMWAILEYDNRGELCSDDEHPHGWEITYEKALKSAATAMALTWTELSHRDALWLTCAPSTL